jgi:hypothetical protein
MLSVMVASFGPPGNPYSQFVRRWWDAVMAMDPPPAEIIVAHTDPEPLGLLPGPGTIPVVTVQVSEPDIAVAMNAAASVATQPWISGIGVDDRYCPDALADLAAADAAGADILVWNNREIGSHVWECFWNPEILQHSNTLAGSCPVRRDLWDRVGGLPRIGWSDWGFWLRCAAAGAQAFHSHRVGVDFDPGLDHHTWSGRAMTREQQASRDAELFAFAAELRG